MPYFRPDVKTRTVYYALIYALIGNNVLWRNATGLQVSWSNASGQLIKWVV